MPATLSCSRDSPAMTIQLLELVVSGGHFRPHLLSPLTDPNAQADLPLRPPATSHNPSSPPEPPCHVVDPLSRGPRSTARASLDRASRALARSPSELRTCAFAHLA